MPILSRLQLYKQKAEEFLHLIDDRDYEVEDREIIKKLEEFFESCYQEGHRQGWNEAEGD